MNKSCQEQHPLLFDDLSEEDQYSPRYKRHYRHMNFRSGAKNNIKGAAAIIKRWPDHWYRTVVYWWIGLGMIAITTLVIYNGVVAFALIPSQQITVSRYPIVNDAKKTATDLSSSFPMVSMHVFVNSVNNLDVNKYMPYIEIISNKFLDYKYRLIFVVNDDNDDYALSDEENNEVALNYLMDNSLTQGNMPNIIIEQVKLSKYMNSSPLKKHWKSLPKQFIEFLVRAISIWEKGGIAFNPLILTPHSPNAIYIEKLQGILKEYKDCSNKQNIKNVTLLETKNNSTKVNKRPSKKHNNIRDIIDDMDQNDGDTYNRHNLLEAEDKNTLAFTVVKPSIKKQTNINETKSELLHKALVQNAALIEPTKFSNEKISTVPNIEQNIDLENSKANFPQYSLLNNNPASLFPLFFNFLFNDKTTTDLSKNQGKKEMEKISLTRKRKSVISKESGTLNNNLTSVSDNNSTMKSETAKYRPMIIPTSISNKLVEYPNSLNELKYYDGQLIIDLKGNIMATKTSCHAFIGTVFNNVIHHSQNESVTDFIISELSLFCKGLLSTCKGIDVILH